MSLVLLEYSTEKFEIFINKNSDQIKNSLFVYYLHPLNHKTSCGSIKKKVKKIIHKKMKTIIDGKKRKA